MVQERGKALGISNDITGKGFIFLGGGSSVFFSLLGMYRISLKWPGRLLCHVASCMYYVM